MRLNIKVNIEYRVIKLPSEVSKQDFEPEYFSMTKNLSAGGLVFVAKEQILIGAIVELKIQLPGIKERIECLARVVRIEEVEAEKAYDTAVCFLDLSGADRAKLIKFVEEEIT